MPGAPPPSYFEPNFIFFNVILSASFQRGRRECLQLPPPLPHLLKIPGSAPLQSCTCQIIACTCAAFHPIMKLSSTYIFSFFPFIFYCKKGDFSPRTHPYSKDPRTELLGVLRLSQYILFLRRSKAIKVSLMAWSMSHSYP